jgi:hypothetical protein
MTSTTTEWDNIGGGWKRDGMRLLWTGEPYQTPRRYLPGSETVRDLVRVSMLKDRDSASRCLRIETGRLDELDDEEDEPAAEDVKELELAADIDDVLAHGGAILPGEAVTGLAYILVRFLGERAIYDIVKHIGDERQAYIERLTAAVGGNLDSTLGEAEAALKAQTS